MTTNTSTATLITTQTIENDTNLDSLVWDSALMGNNSGVAIVWGDLDRTHVYLTMANRGGTLGGQVSINITRDANSQLHVAAVGQNRFVVVADEGDNSSPNAAFTIYDSNGNQVKASTTIGATNNKHYEVANLGDGSFIIKWVNGTSTFYTRYDQNGVAYPGQTAQLLTTAIQEGNTARAALAGDGTGGFMYSTQVSSDGTLGSNLKYVSSTGTITQVATAAGYRGTLAYDGTNFVYFNSNTTNNQIYMQKVSVASGLVGPAVAINGFTSTETPIVKALPNGGFLLQDHDKTEVFIVNNAGTVLDTYIPGDAIYGSAAVASDSGAVWVENYPDSTGSGLYDLKVGALDSVYFVPPPVVGTPGAVGFTDTQASDTFIATAAAVLSVSSEAQIPAYGIQGGTTGISHVIGGFTYDVSKAGSYGTLYLQSGTGRYSYEPNSTAINQLQASASETFTVTAANAAGTSGSATLTVNVTGVNDLPVIGNLNGNAGQFTAGASDPVTDNAHIAPTTVTVTDVDSANLGSGYLQINQASGATDGYFVTDATKVKAGTTAAGADAHFSAGENVYVDTSGAGTTFTSIGTVGSGGALHIDFNSSATSAQVAWLLKYLNYGAASGGLRSFTAQVNDGDGGTSASSSFTMNGVDLTPPTLSSTTPADDATNVAVATSPQIVFNEAVKFGTGKIYLVDVAANTVVEQFDVATAQGTADGKVSISGSTLTINPTDPLGYGKTYAIKVDNGAITDLAGNAFAGISNTTTFNFTTFADPPTVTISADAASLTAGGHATITFTFSTTPVGFTETDIDVAGGTVSGLMVDPGNDKLYTATFTPNAAQSLNATIQIAAGKFTNAGAVDNAASNVVSITGDTLAPTVASIERSAPAGSPTNADSLTFLVTFSETITHLDAADFAVSGSTATVTGVSPAGGNAWLVTVQGGDLALLNGTVALSISSGNDLADAVGNALSSTTPTGANQSYSVDNAISPPGLALAEDTGASNSDGITANGVVNVTLAPDVAAWKYSVDGGATWVAGTGTSFTLPGGTYAANAVMVSQTDFAGNESTAANGSAIQVITDVALPWFSLDTDSGANATDGITNVGTINVDLPATVASWKYSLNGGTDWVTGSGTSFNLPEGTYAAHSIAVRYTDLAGNSAEVNNSQAYTVDKTAPAAASLALAADTGSSNSDGISSNHTVSVTLAGDAATWQYSIDGGSHWVDGSGTSFTLPDGTYAIGSIQVRQADLAGNVSAPASNTSAFQIDTSADAPSFVLAHDGGKSASDGITKDGTVSVTLPADMASWEYSTDSGGHWATGTGAAFELVEGAYASGAVQVRYLDVAGNQSAAASSTAAITVDKTVAAPALTLPADNGTSTSDGLTSNKTVTVTLDPDHDSWEYSINGGGWVAGTGTSFDLADGTYAAGAIKVRQTDIAGNVSAEASSTSAITVDTGAAPPSISLATDSGDSGTDGITNDGTIQITLPADADTWEYSVDGGAHWTGGTGVQFTLSPGVYAAGDVQARYTDKSGNHSAAGQNASAITVDKSVSVPTLALGSDTGASGSDGITKDALVTVTLASDATSWEYSVDGGTHWADGSGTSFTLPDGSYAAGTVQVRQTDLAGNHSAIGSNAAAIKIDTTAAAASFALATDTGRSASDGISSNGAVNVTLPTDADSWEYSTDGGATWVAGAGTGFTLAVGNYAGGDIRVRYTDIAGNASTVATNPSTVSIDNTAPDPSFALRSDNGPSPTDGITNDPRINVTLPADVATWEYSTDGGAHWKAGVGAEFNLPGGTYEIGQVKVHYTDIAGNHSADVSNSTKYTILAVSPPEPPPIVIDTPPVVIDGVPVQTGTVTNPDGSVTHVIKVPVVTPGRVDTNGNSVLADIPLGTKGVDTVLTAQLPTGYGLQVAGAVTPQSVADSLAELTRQIQAHNGSGDLLASGSGFLSKLGQSGSVLVQSVTPTLGSGAGAGADNGHLVFSGAAHTDGAPATALVIDARGLPSGTTIELQNVDFAALVGNVRATGGAGSQTVQGDGASQYIVLGPDDDILHGGAGDDVVGSEGGNDKIYGDEGNDTVFGGEGNDYIDGGSGTDTLIMQGASRADYSLRFDHGNLVATALHGGTDGVDTIANVEMLRFAGAEPDMGVEASLRRLYDTAFDRAADAAGSAYWSAANAHGMSMHDIAASLLGSGEAGGLAALANAAFVDKLYHDALGSSQPVPVDDAAHWTALLDQGKADRADVLAGIAASSQKLALDAQEQSQIAFADTDAAMVVRLYATVFGRHGDEAGVNYWIERSESGWSMSTIANVFLRSDEGQLHYGSKTNADFVDAVYHLALGRDCSAQEAAYWTGMLADNELTRTDMLLFVANSAEQIGLVGNSTTIDGLVPGA